MQYNEFIVFYKYQDSNTQKWYIKKRKNEIKLDIGNYRERKEFVTINTPEY